MRLQLLVKFRTGEELARELVNTLAVEYGISSKDCLQPCEIELPPM